MCPAVELARSRRSPKCFWCTSSSGHIVGSPPSLGPRPSSIRGCARLSRVRLLDEDEICRLLTTIHHACVYLIS